MVRKNVFEILKHSKNVIKEEFCDFVKKKGITDVNPDMKWDKIEKEVRMDARVGISDIRNKWPEEFGIEVEEEKTGEKEGKEQKQEEQEEGKKENEEGEKEEVKTEEEPDEVEIGEESVKIIKEDEVEEERGLFDKLKIIVSSFIDKIFRKKDKFQLGIYGATNVGKTTLANQISEDWLGEEVGKTSAIPHETRKIQQKENIEIEKGGKELTINLVDTPGISTKVDFEEFLDYDFDEDNAKKRAKEATKGIIEAIRWLDDMDVVLAVMDATKDPLSQVNLTILGNLEARGIPVLIVANKLDKDEANLERIKAAFPQYDTVGISAKEGMKMDGLYEEIFEVTR